MNFSNILNEVVGKSADNSSGNMISGLSKSIPGGLAGGAVAGGLVAMLVGSKSVRKTAGKAAKYGGAALLGGLAYKAYKGWQADNTAQSKQRAQASEHLAAEHFEREAIAHSNGDASAQFQLTLLKAMIAAARADGHIDEDERNKIFQAVKQMNMDDGAKTKLLDLFLEPIAIGDFIHELQTLEQKSEVYLASCLVIELDHDAEYAYLSELSKALALPAGLEQQLRAQAANAVSEAA